MKKTLIPLKEAAYIAGCCSKTIINWRNSVDVDLAYKVGGRWLVWKERLLRYLNHQTKTKNNFPGWARKPKIKKRSRVS